MAYFRVYVNECREIHGKAPLLLKVNENFWKNIYRARDIAQEFIPQYTDRKHGFAFKRHHVFIVTPPHKHLLDLTAALTQPYITYSGTPFPGTASY